VADRADSPLPHKPDDKRIDRGKSTGGAPVMMSCVATGTEFAMDLDAGVGDGLFEQASSPGGRIQKFLNRAKWAAGGPGAL